MSEIHNKEELMPDSILIEDTKNGLQAYLNGDITFEQFSSLRRHNGRMAMEMLGLKPDEPIED